MAPWRIVLFGVVWRVTKWLGILLLARTFFRSNNASPTVVAAMSSLIIPRCCAYLFDAFIRVWEEILCSKRNELKPCASELPRIEAEIW
ncbi:hypothetical protein TIFTF001_002435 [Ficus carica]|uniref:Uncharacterized protein n=1 Tax=Ficus carica TaxID=3494 RepID=A0AA88CS70_FICCA|nr:hypothetical protein TIFTF001_002435 [Ficus carica]